jgi:manganese/zinc/iron transport system permease protein
VFVVNLLFVLVLYKELKISSFDPTLATTLGVNASLMHYLLMTMVAITTVASFETVGSILVIAMLIVPAAAAHLLTDRLPTMIVASLVIAVLSAVLGHLGAITVPTWFGFSDTTTAGMMGVVAGVIFLVVMIVSPRHGVAVKMWHRAMLSLRIIEEDALGVLYRLEELGRSTDEPGMRGLVRAAVHVNPLVSWVAMRRLANARRLHRSGDGYKLTDAGRQVAREVVRTHRLWETYLSHQLGMPADHLHLSASRLEHLRDRAVEEQLRAETGQPATDPHGRAVPPKSE